eukprot:scaffold1361_cov66-Phaeocystis_antarctica.AAC.2
MRTDLPGSQNRPFRAPRANSPCRIAYIRGVHRSGPHRDVRRNLGVRFRLIRAVSARRTTQSCIDPAFWLNPVHVVAPRGWPCAAEGKRCSGRIGTPRPRRDPRRLDRLVSRTQCK